MMLLHILIVPQKLGKIILGTYIIGKLEVKSATQWLEVRAKLAKIWGYADFRSPQGEIVQSLLAQQDTLIVLPTGAGKSICFQLPALFQQGLTLVVSPLVALMENQVQELLAKGLPAAALHSELPPARQRQVLQAVSNQQLRLLYLSPETLLSDRLWSIISRPQIHINGLILDEAHCLVQWGETFRPAYRRLGAVRPALLAHKPQGTKIPIAAFTATADPVAQATITQVLQLQQPTQFLISPHRPNLHLVVKTVWTPRSRRQQLRQFIDRQANQVGLVYVRTRHDAEELATELNQSGRQTMAYHAGLSPQQRRAIEQQWLSGALNFVICTCAFGMGINKPDVRWIAHFQSPLLLSEYVQEIGRAGRDGLPATALMLVCEPTGWLYPDDQQRHQFFMTQLRQLELQAQQLAPKIPIAGEIAALSRQFPKSEISLALWHRQGLLEWTSPFHYRRLVGKVQPTAPGADRQMQKYANTRNCRWQYLLTAFGFTDQGAAWRCGHCDSPGCK
jgi:ATP-dependent DNA helicase RecQ